MLLTLLQSQGAPPTTTTVWLKVAGIWKQTTVFTKVSGVWKSTTPKIKVSGTWK